ncbi:MAG: TIGR00282 family metallophosphoesterase [Clostridia bacterium]|nr:TIGR00282 family metallophosphoesterase [Clostridia bacterium]
MNILCVGDVVGQPGTEYLTRHLPQLKKQYAVDVCVVNGENAAEGNGITPDAADTIFRYGADVITTGNHVFRRREIYPVLESNPALLRPANYPPSVPGAGWYIVDKGRVRVAVGNLLGTVYLDPLASPFETADALLRDPEKPTVCVLDFHAEATAEKRALACWLDGRVSLVYGTHTHVQTADEQILPGGTGFMTDIGMTGPVQSVLGVVPEQSIARIKDHMPVHFTTAPGPCRLCGVLAQIDEKTGHTTAIRRIAV